MARKRPTSKTPSLFSTDFGVAAAPRDASPPDQGEPHVQDARPPAPPEPVPGNALPAQTGRRAAAGSRSLFDDAEDRTPGLDQLLVRGEAGIRPRADQGGSAGNRPPGVDGPFVGRVAAGGRGLELGRGDGLHQGPLLRRVTRRPSLFDGLFGRAADASAEPVTAVSAEPPPAALGNREPLRGPAELAIGEKAKARDILAAIRTLKRIESEGRPANPS